MRIKVQYMGKLVEIVDPEIDGIDMSDYPDFCDAYLSYATWENGIELTDQELEDITSDNGDVVYELVQETLY